MANDIGIGQVLLPVVAICLQLLVSAHQVNRFQQGLTNCQEAMAEFINGYLNDAYKQLSEETNRVLLIVQQGIDVDDIADVEIRFRPANVAPMVVKYFVDGGQRLHQLRAAIRRGRCFQWVLYILIVAVAAIIVGQLLFPDIVEKKWDTFSTMVMFAYILIWLFNFLCGRDLIDKVGEEYGIQKRN